MTAGEIECTSTVGSSIGVLQASTRHANAFEHTSWGAETKEKNGVMGRNTLTQGNGGGKQLVEPKTGIIGVPVAQHPLQWIPSLGCHSSQQNGILAPRIHVRRIVACRSWQASMPPQHIPGYPISTYLHLSIKRNVAPAQGHTHTHTLSLAFFLHSHKRKMKL